MSGDMPAVDTVAASLAGYVQSELRDFDPSVSVGFDDDLVDLGFDSVAYVRLLAHINTRYGIRIADADVTLDRFGTVGSISRYLRDRGVTSMGSAS